MYLRGLQAFSGHKHFRLQIMHTSVDRALFMLINALTLCMTWYKLNRIRRLNLWEKMYKQFWGKIYCILLDNYISLTSVIDS